MSDRLDPPKRYDRRVEEPVAREDSAAVRSERKRLSFKNEFFTLGGIDIPFFAIVVALVTIGLVMLFSATYPYGLVKHNDSYYFFKHQLVYVVVGIVAMLIVSKLNYRLLQKYMWPLLGVTVLLLIVVLFYHTDFKDFKRWIPLVGGATFQPSDLAKFTVVVVLANYMAKNHKRMYHWLDGIVYPGVILLGFCLLIYLENHNSGMILIFLIGLSLMVAGGSDLRLIGLGVVVVAAGAFFILNHPEVLQDYAQDRIRAFTDKSFDPLDARWQTNNSLYAIGSGGFFGVGLGNSKQKFMYVSEPQNDFIFSIVCEELGFIGATVIILLFALLFFRGLQLAMKSKDTFSALVIIGIVSQVALQTILNILVVTDSIPNTGISLPFFSAGGTSIVMLLAEMGVVLSISRATNQKKV